MILTRFHEQNQIFKYNKDNMSVFTFKNMHWIWHVQQQTVYKCD